MRKFLVAAAVATTALAAAAPAAAQYYPAPVNPYQQPYYGQGYGYNQNNHGLIRSYQVRVDRLQRAIARMDSRDRISEREARSLRVEARWVEQRVRAFGYNGRLTNRERYDLDIRLARLEQRLVHELRDGNNRPGGNYGQGYYGQGYSGQGYNGQGYNGQGYNPYGGGQWIDRDRDGRDDRYEDDRGRYPG